jgi:hypothetical protein
MRLLGLAVVCLALAGCSSWEGDVRFKVTRIAPPYESMGQMRPALVVMDVVGEAPKSARVSSPESAEIDQFPADVKVGDEVLCKVGTVEDNSLDDVGPKTAIGPCRRP